MLASIPPSPSLRISAIQTNPNNSTRSVAARACARAFPGHIRQLGAGNPVLQETTQTRTVPACAYKVHGRVNGGEGKRSWKVRAMGVEKQVLQAGNGPKPRKGQKVTVHCTGFGKNGDLSQKFWSTKDPGQQAFTFEIGLGKVIKGWDEGVMGMQVGEVARLQCSPDYAYGSGGFPAWGIQPNSPLIFEIEVLGLKD